MLLKRWKSARAKVVFGGSWRRGVGDSEGVARVRSLLQVYGLTGHNPGLYQRLGFSRDQSEVGVWSPREFVKICGLLTGFARLERGDPSQKEAHVLQEIVEAFQRRFSLDHEERQGKLLWLCFKKSWRRFSLDHGERQGGESGGAASQRERRVVGGTPTVPGAGFSMEGVARVCSWLQVHDKAVCHPGSKVTVDDTQLVLVQRKITGPWSRHVSSSWRSRGLALDVARVVSCAKECWLPSKN